MTPPNPEAIARPTPEEVEALVVEAGRRLGGRPDLVHHGELISRMAIALSALSSSQPEGGEGVLRALLERIEERAAQDAADKFGEDDADGRAYLVGRARGLRLAASMLADQLTTPSPSPRLAEGVGEQAKALMLARDKFREYAVLHSAKHTDEGDEKAATNRAMADMCAEALIDPRATP